MTQAPAPLGTRAALSDGRRGSRPSAHLFVELRGFADVIQSGSSNDAAAALLRFSGSVVDATAGYPTSELRAEGDSAYVTFTSAADAVTCALLIIGGAAATTGPRPAAGVAADSDARGSDGYLAASAVSSAAAPGEVLVTDDARRLAGSTSELAFSRAVSRWSRGSDTRRGLWVATAATAASRRQARAWGRAASLVAVLATALVVLAAAVVWPRVQPSAAALKNPITIGAQLPLGGEAADFGASLENAVTLAIADAEIQAGSAGPRIVLRAVDGGTQNELALAASTMHNLVADPSVLAVVGPAWSSTAQTDIPIGNAAGLLQCSPSTTNPSLTKPRFGGLDLRAADPDRISFVRPITTDDMQGPAAASFVFTPPSPGSSNVGIPATHGLGVSHVLVIDDTSSYGRNVADAFQQSFEAKGGVADRRAHNPGADDLAGTLAPLGAAIDPAEAVYFGGDAGPALEVKAAMAAAGYAATPLVSSDALFDGTGADSGSFIQLAGPLAANTYITQAGVAPVDADFQARYRRDFGVAPSDYAAAAYACAQVIIAALGDAIAHGTPEAALREAVRAAAVDGTRRTQTVIGDVGFDANGDSLDQYVTFYSVVPGADGKGEWGVFDQQNFGPAP